MMSDETGKTKAIIDLAASNQRMRELLQKVAGIAEAASALAGARSDAGKAVAE